MNGLGNGFTFDDVTIVAENPRIRSLSVLRSAFTTDWWNNRHPQSLLYRPLTMTSFALDYALVRAGATEPPPARLPNKDARPFHVQNVVWHAAACIFLFLLVAESFSSAGLGLATAALFAVHPVHAEAVDGIVGRAELMSAAFAFLALLFSWRTLRDDAKGFLRPGLAGVFLFAALLSKEQAIVVPAVALLWLLPLSREDLRLYKKKGSVPYLAASLTLATIVYLAMRGAVLGSPFASGTTERARIVIDNPLVKAEGAARLWTPVSVLGTALRLLVYPRTLSADYSYDQLPLVSTPDVATLAAAGALAALVAGVILLRRRKPAVSFGLGLFLISWFLTSNLLIVIGTIFGERLLYLPSAGACLALPAAVLAAGKHLRQPRVAAGLLSIVTMVFAARTFARNADWKDNLTLFASAAVTSPRSCKALNGYASELFTAGRPQEAIPWAEAALRVLPDYPSAHQTIAKCLRLLAKDAADPAAASELRARAEEHGRWLVAYHAAAPGDGSGLADAWNVLGSLALDRKAVDEAMADYGKSLSASHDYVPAITGLGAATAMKAESENDSAARDRLRESALSRFERALVLDPGSAQARQNAAAMLRALAESATDAGRRDEMLRRAQTYDARAIAAQQDTGDVAGLANLHGVTGTRLLGEKRLDAALLEFKEAIRLQPDAARGYLGMGTVLVAQADEAHEGAAREALVDEALRQFERALALEPDNPSAHMNLGITYLTRRHDPARVAAEFRAYLRLVPDAPQRAQMEGTIRQMDALTGKNNAAPPATGR